MNINIKPYQNNAKQHSAAQLYKIALSIKSFEWQQPIKLGKDNVILAGHARWGAYNKYKTEMSLAEPWIINEIGETILGQPSKKILTEEEEKTYRLADNLVASTDYDMDIVLEESNQLSIPFQELLQFDLVSSTQKEDKTEEKIINDEGAMAYLKQTIRQMVMVYDQKEFEIIMDKVNKLLEYYRFDTKDKLFSKYINEDYEKHFTN